MATFKNQEPLLERTPKRDNTTCEEAAQTGIARDCGTLSGSGICASALPRCAVHLPPRSPRASHHSDAWPPVVRTCQGATCKDLRVTFPRGTPSCSQRLLSVVWHIDGHPPRSGLESTQQTLAFSPCLTARLQPSTYIKTCTRTLDLRMCGHRKVWNLLTY